MPSRVQLNKSPGNFKFGAYAVVFFQPQGRATKVFKRRFDCKETHVRNVFQSEVHAYELACKVPELSSIIPEYFRIVNLAYILDPQGRSIIGEFLPDCAYQMSFAQGTFIKSGMLSSYQNLSNLFRRHGINHLIDASVVLDDCGKVRSVIGFAVKEHELVYDEP